MNKKGFTILELIIAIVVFTVIGSTISLMYIMSLNTKESSNNKNKAMILANNKMEELYSLNNDSVVLLNNNIENYNTINNYSNYKRLILINKEKDTDLLKLEINVFWKQNNFEKKYSLIGLKQNWRKDLH